MVYYGFVVTLYLNLVGDKGEWVYDRIIVIECNNVIPVNKRDKDLVSHLLEEKEYIVSLAIKGLKQVIANDYKYNIPKICKKLRKNYKIANNSFLSFYKECVIDRPSKKIEDKCTVKKFYNVYRAWCKDNNNGFAESKQEVQRLLENMGKGSKIKTNGGYFFYRTITLNRETQTAYEEICGPVDTDFSDDEDPEEENHKYMVDISSLIHGEDVDISNLKDIDINMDNIDLTELDDNNSLNNKPFNFD